MAIGPGNTCRTELEVLMTSLKKLNQFREYRSRLASDSADVLISFIEQGKPENQMEMLRYYLNNVNLRIHLLNQVINKMIASEPRLLQGGKDLRN